MPAPPVVRDIVIDGKSFVGIEWGLPGAPLLAIQGAKGFVMCGYLDVSTADKVDVPAAVVRGVRTLDELLAKPVSAVSKAADILGVRPGMTGSEALAFFS